MRILTKVSILTASRLNVLLGSLRILLHRSLSESNIFENLLVNLFHSDLMSIGKTENRFKAAPSIVAWIRAVRLCIQF